MYIHCACEMVLCHNFISIRGKSVVHSLIKSIIEVVLKHYSYLIRSDILVPYDQFENFGANDWYFTATLLDKSPVDNNNIFPPVLMKEPLDSAFGFLTGYVDTPWVYKITQPTLVWGFYSLSMSL